MVKFVHNYKYENEFKFLKFEDPMFHVSLIYLVKSLLNKSASAKGCQIKSTSVYIYFDLESCFNDQREKSSKAKEERKARAFEIQALWKGQVYIRGWDDVQGRGAKFKRSLIHLYIRWPSFRVSRLSATVSSVSFAPSDRHRCTTCQAIREERRRGEKR